ncbi:hypothetical protein [Photobacterium iliopiscarium]|uniref:Uncharacterized protein n=1 Tax=Photobacterium iliopiscarium TaxID=56192 RepID=A0ABX5GM18_9GAMM|nr:hypothetical protein [Photobacterium iliopiscarium]PSW90482.1 hypothetical protein C9J52_19700 [Photobacterium iliopiscarium]
MNKKRVTILLVVLLSGCTTNNYYNNRNYGNGTITVESVPASQDVRVLNGLHTDIGLKPTI